MKQEHREKVLLSLKRPEEKEKDVAQKDTLNLKTE